MPCTFRRHCAGFPAHAAVPLIRLLAKTLALRLIAVIKFMQLCQSYHNQDEAGTHTHGLP